MAFRRNFFNFFFKINRKRRLSLRKEHNDAEVWYMHISPLEMIGGVVAVLLILFIAILSLVAYTPILNLIPGYSGNRARAEMIENIIRVDSIQRKLDDLQIYYNNVSLIMEGKTPINRNVNQVGDSLSVSAAEMIAPGAADSLLRRELEGDGEYSLANSVASRQTIRPGVELMTPVRGIISEQFSPREGRYGITISTPTSQQVLAVYEGTVISSLWTPEEGYIIQIQHPDNLVSTYRHGTISLIPVGTRVRAGEVISTTAESAPGGETKAFVFELWQNGSAVDPENYIVF